MSSYKKFAKVYDEFMSEIPYQKWAVQIKDYLDASGKKTGDVLELGCGTGTFLNYIKEYGYNTTGMDLSEDMLAIARKKYGRTIEFLLDDMRAFETDRKYQVILSVCDSMNYMENTFDLQSVMERVGVALSEDGLFIFDMKTKAFYEQLGNQVFTDSNESGSYIWENEFDEETGDNYYYLTFFIKGFAGLYKKYNEEHLQHVFSPEEVGEAAKKNGLRIREILGMDMRSEADFEAERVYYVLERSI